MFFNEKQKCLYRVFNENTKCLLFHFLNALFSGLFAQKLSHLFYLRTIVLHEFQIILFHGLILHFFFIEPLSCFSLRCKQHCLLLWRKYLIKAAGWFVQHAIVVHIFFRKIPIQCFRKLFCFSHMDSIFHRIIRLSFYYRPLPY